MCSQALVLLSAVAAVGAVVPHQLLSAQTPVLPDHRIDLPYPGSDATFFNTPAASYSYGPFSVIPANNPVPNFAYRNDLNFVEDNYPGHIFVTNPLYVDRYQSGSFPNGQGRLLYVFNEARLRNAVPDNSISLVDHSDPFQQPQIVLEHQVREFTGRSRPGSYHKYPGLLGRHPSVGPHIPSGDIFGLQSRSEARDQEFGLTIGERSGQETFHQVSGFPTNSGATGVASGTPTGRPDAFQHPAGPPNGGRSFESPDGRPDGFQQHTGSLGRPGDRIFGHSPNGNSGGFQHSDGPHGGSDARQFGPPPGSRPGVFEHPPGPSSGPNTGSLFRQSMKSGFQQHPGAQNFPRSPDGASSGSNLFVPQQHGPNFATPGGPQIERRRPETSSLHGPPQGFAPNTEH